MTRCPGRALASLPLTLFPASERLILSYVGRPRGASVPPVCRVTENTAHGQGLAGGFSVCERLRAKCVRRAVVYFKNVFGP